MPRDPLGFEPTSELGVLRSIADVRHIAAASPPWASPMTLMQTLRAVREHEAELVHLQDARYAAVGRWLQVRRRIPVTAAVSSRDVQAGRGWPRTDRGLGRLDSAFTSEASVYAALRERHYHLDVHSLPPVGRALPWPNRRRMTAMTRLLRDVRPGRLVVAVPWLGDRQSLRAVRDQVIPLLDGSPLCLVLGAPSHRDARLMFGARGLQHDFRVHVGSLDVDTIGAAARCADLFLLPTGQGRQWQERSSNLEVALAVGGIPMVTQGESDSRVLAHERNAFVVESDDQAFVRTINQLLSLPAVQRHALGEDFARYTMRRWTVEAAAEVFGERFAALVGRPRIPLEFRAAA